MTCEQTTERVYNDSVPFSPIIGYMGRVQEDQLANALGRRRAALLPNDIVAGRESSSTWSRICTERRDPAPCTWTMSAM